MSDSKLAEAIAHIRNLVHPKGHTSLGGNDPGYGTPAADIQPTDHVANAKAFLAAHDAESAGDPPAG